MVIINQSILGPFSGNVGSVVGGSWKGINYMRVLTNQATQILKNDKITADGENVANSAYLGSVEVVA